MPKIRALFFNFWKRAGEASSLSLLSSRWKLQGKERYLKVYFTDWKWCQKSSFSSTTYSNRLKIAFMKIVPLCQYTYGTSNLHPEKENVNLRWVILQQSCSLFKHFKMVLIILAWESSYSIISQPRGATNGAKFTEKHLSWSLLFNRT